MMKPGLSSKGGIVVTFGRHKGKELGSLCDSYLQWMASTLQQGQCAIWGALAQQVLDERNQCPPGAAQAQQHTVDQLDEWGVQVDTSTYASLLRQCASAKDVAEGKRVHAHIVRRGFHRHTFLGNLLMHMYSRCGDVEEACVVFNQMVRRNLFSWNILMAAYAHRGHLCRARGVYDGMPMRDVVSWNVMIAAYAQNGDAQGAGKVFQEAEDRDMVSWNAAIAAYAQNGHGKRAVELFGMLDLEGMHPPDVYTLISVFDACASIPALAEGRLIHAEVAEIGLELLNDAGVGNSLVNMYGKCAGVEEAKSVFDAIPQRDVVSWNALVGACISNGELEEARRMFECRMPWRNVVSWNAMIAAYSRSADLENAKRVFEGMPEKNVVSWNAMISACVQNGCSEEGIGLFKLMQEQGFQADKITLVTVLDACANSADAALGESIYAKLVGSGLGSDVVVANAMIHLRSKCGNVGGARRLFDGMRQRDVVSWTSMVAAHAQSGDGEEALQLFRGLLIEGVQPNKITLVSVLSACSHAGLLDEGWALFVSLDADYGIPLALEHYICMIDLLGRAGHVAAAQELTKSMPFEPDAVAWRTLLSACKLQGALELLNG